MSIAIVSALPREIAGLIRGNTADPALKKRGIALYRAANAVVVAGGMGADRVTLAVQAARDAMQIDTLVSVGLAGSCRASTKVGTLVRAGTVIDARTGERFDTLDASEVDVLVSADEIASAREKARLYSTYNASMVDMEAATVARLARAHGLGFRAWKGISDAHDFEIESLARFAGPSGQFQVASFALYAALRPQMWGHAMQLGKHSKAAVRLLTEALIPLTHA